MMKRYLPLLAWLAVGGLPSQSLAQKVGPEFQVNTYTTGTQYAPSVASGTAGNFVVVWQSRDQDGSLQGIFGQRYNSTGNRVGSEFLVNSYTTDNQFSPCVASDASGNFIVVWSSEREDAEFNLVLGQRYDQTGNRLGGEFQISMQTPYNQLMPCVASDASGNFVVVWGSRFSDIIARRYDNGGNPLGEEFQVESYSSGGQNTPSVASDASGNFVVVWDSIGQDGSLIGVFGQRYDESGNPLGGEFQVNTYTTNHQTKPSVAWDSSGNFIVVWESYPGQDGSSTGIFGRRYDGNGNPLGGEFQVNTYTTGYQSYPSVASAADGGFVVVWSSSGDQDGSDFGIFGQEYDHDGIPSGEEFQVNTYTTDRQIHGRVASAASGDFVVAWYSYGQDAMRSWGIFGQRFAAPRLLSVSDVWVTEGDSKASTGVVQALLTITLSAPSQERVTVDYATADGTATAPADYLARSGRLTFQPGQTSKTVTVSVKGETKVEDDETFFFNLSNPLNATIADGQGIGTILNDDP